MEWQSIATVPKDGRRFIFSTIYKGERVETVAQWAAERAPNLPIAAYGLDSTKMQFTTFCKPCHEGDFW